MKSGQFYKFSKDFQDQKTDKDSLGFRLAKPVTVDTFELLDMIAEIKVKDCLFCYHDVVTCEGEDYHAFSIASNRFTLVDLSNEDILNNLVEEE